MYNFSSKERLARIVTFMIAMGASVQYVDAHSKHGSHRQMARANEMSCAKGTYNSIADPFTSRNKKLWRVKKNRKGLEYTEEGLKMHTTEKTPVTMLESTSSWGPPLLLTFKAKSQDYGGIVNSVAFLKFWEKEELPTVNGIAPVDIVNGSEIDLEIVPGQFQVPLWIESDDPTKAIRLEPGTDVREDILGDDTSKTTTLTPKYAYEYKDYDPTELLEYQLEWNENTVTWFVEGVARVSFRPLVGGRFPKGPLPLRIGPWATENNPGSNWAGQIDWAKNPKAMFLISDLHLKGCQSTND